MERPTDTEREHWEREGYIVLEDAVVGDELSHLQSVFDKHTAEAKEDWLNGIAAGTAPPAFFDIPSPLEKDEIFIDLVDHPSWYGYLMDFADDDLIFLAPSVRTVPLSPVSYVGWHPDVPFTRPLHMKVQLYLNDIPEDGGPFAYVPGSHIEGKGPYPQVKRLDAMPGHKVFPGEAGTAILFNSYGWHTSMLNRTNVPRKSIILIYEKFNAEVHKGKRFEEVADRLETSERRKLFGVER